MKMCFISTSKSLISLIVWRIKFVCYCKTKTSIKEAGQKRNVFEVIKFMFVVYLSISETGGNYLLWNNYYLVSTPFIYFSQKYLVGLGLPKRTSTIL